MNPAWLIYHIIDAIRSPSNRPPVRDIYCPDWLALLLGWIGVAVLYAVVATEAIRVFTPHA